MRAPASRDRLERFFETLGRSLRLPLRFYLVGGAAIVDLGLRPATLDIDYVARADNPEALRELERQLPRLKDDLDINVEPASPSDFMPVPEGAIERSTYVRSYGPVAVYHYDFPTLVLAKIARGAERDVADIELLLRTGAVTWTAVEAAWMEIRDREDGWLRHTPIQVERRMASMAQRLRASGLLGSDLGAGQ